MMYVVCTLACVPLALPLRLAIQSGGASVRTRHRYCFVGGLSLGLLCFGRSVVHPLVLSLVCYLLCRKVDRAHVGVVVTLVAMLHLSYCHLGRMRRNYYGHILDVTGCMMVLVQRVSLVAFALQDDERRVVAGVAAPAADLPLEEFLGYCFFFPTVLAGPTPDPIHFRAAISGSVLESFRQRTGLQEPSTKAAVLTPLGFAVVAMALTLLLGRLFPLELLAEPHYSRGVGVLYGWLHLHLAALAFRCQYFFVWSLSEASCNLCYCGFGGLLPDGTQDWSQCTNVRPLRFETASCSKVAFDNWNILTSSWLRKVVYLRVRQHRVLLTFVMSALWHGFYPHYYYVFAVGALMTYLSRFTRRTLRPHFLSSRAAKTFYDLLTTLTTAFVYTYHIPAFALLDFTATARIWRKFFYLGHLGFVVASAVALVAWAQMQNPHPPSPPP